MATKGEVVRHNTAKPAGPALLKSCGWAGWNLAAARLVPSHAWYFQQGFVYLENTFFHRPSAGHTSKSRQH